MKKHKKTLEVAEKKIALAKVLTAIENNKTLKKQIKNLDQLAENVILMFKETNTSIGYSTLLAQPEYRRLLDLSLINIRPSKQYSYSKKLSLNNSSPEELQQRIRELEFDIGDFIHKEKIYKNQLAEKDGIEIIKPQLNHENKEHGTFDSNKTCMALNFLLEYLYNEGLGIEFCKKSNTIKNALGTVIVHSSHLEPYSSWIKNNEYIDD